MDVSKIEKVVFPKVSTKDKYVYKFESSKVYKTCLPINRGLLKILEKEYGKYLGGVK